MGMGGGQRSGQARGLRHGPAGIGQAHGGAFTGGVKNGDGIRLRTCLSWGLLRAVQGVQYARESRRRQIGG